MKTTGVWDQDQDLLIPEVSTWATAIIQKVNTTNGFWEQQNGAEDLKKEEK